MGRAQLPLGTGLPGGVGRVWEWLGNFLERTILVPSSVTCLTQRAPSEDLTTMLSPPRMPDTQGRAAADKATTTVTRFRNGRQGCAICGLGGHTTPTCPERDTPRCAKCGSVWHLTRRCRSEDGDYLPPGANGGTKRRNSDQDQRRITRVTRRRTDRCEQCGVTLQDDETEDPPSLENVRRCGCPR